MGIKTLFTIYLKPADWFLNNFDYNSHEENMFITAKFCSMILKIIENILDIKGNVIHGIHTIFWKMTAIQVQGSTEK